MLSGGVANAPPPATDRLTLQVFPSAATNSLNATPPPISFLEIHFHEHRIIILGHIEIPAENFTKRIDKVQPTHFLRSCRIFHNGAPAVLTGSAKPSEGTKSVLQLL